MAENIPHELFTTVAQASNLLEARWTIAGVTPHRAWMSTGKFLLTGSFARWNWDTALDRRIKLGDSARAIQRLNRDELARFAITNVAEVSALVQSA